MELEIKTIHVIINPASGQPKPVLHTLNQIFGKAGIQWDISVTKGEGDATRFARQAAERGVDAVVAFGGDGTQMAVAQGLRGTDVPMGVLPGGTANLLSVELGIPDDLSKAAALIIDPKSTLRPVDMGHAVLRGGEAEYDFILRIGISFEGLKIEKADRTLKDKFGEFAYTIAGLESFKEVEPAHFHLTLDGQHFEIDAINLLVTNAGNFGVPGYTRSTKINISDGLLDVLTAQDKSLVSLATLVVKALEKKGEEERPIWQARKISIDAQPPQPINGDGELWGNTPVDISVIPGAVQILTPSE